MNRNWTWMLLACALSGCAWLRKPAPEPDDKPKLGARVGCAVAQVFGSTCGGAGLAPSLLEAAAGWTSTAEKVVDARSINEAAARAGVKVPADTVTLLDYELTAEAGAPVGATGQLRLIGHASSAPQVVQSMMLTKATGERASETPQLARLDVVDGAGVYRVTGHYPIPPSLGPADYVIHAVLYIDGKEAAQRDLRIHALP